MSKKRHPLPLIFKLILFYFYLGAFGSVLYAAMYVLAPKDILFDAYSSMSTIDEIVQRLLVVIPALIFIALSIWAIRLFHMRRNEAVFATVMLTVASYGLFSFGEVDGGIPSVEATLFSTYFFVVDIALVAFMLKSKQVKKVFSK